MAVFTTATTVTFTALGTITTSSVVLGSAATGATLFTFGSSTLAAVVAFGLNTLVGAATSFLFQSVFGPDAPKQGFGVQGKLRGGGAVPRSCIIGRGATAGSLVYSNTWGTADSAPNLFLVQVIALSDLPVQGLNAVWINGERVTLLDGEAIARGAPVEEYREGTKDYAWVKFYDGTQTVADPYLVATFGDHPDRPYGSDRVGTGVAYAIVTTRVNRELFSGFPSFRFELTGMPLYDPSKDSTVGGSGTQRWDDPATWGGDGDDLPAVQLYNLMRGLRYDGDWVYGLQGVTGPQLPASDWIAEIEKCRATITESGGENPTYTSGGEIVWSAQIKSAMEALLTACHGRISETGGTYRVHVGRPGAAVDSFTDDDIISTAQQQFTPFIGLADSVNGIDGRFPNPDEAWAVKSAPPLRRPALEAEDGDRRLLTAIDYDLVYRKEQVQRLMRQALRESRRARRHTLQLGPGFQPWEPGDIVQWTSERNGYSAKKFRVDGVVDLSNLDVAVDLTEIDPDDYDWTTATDYEAIEDGSVGPLRPASQAVPGYTVSAVTIQDGSGAGRRPGVRIAWTADDLDDARAVRWAVRLSGGGAVVARGSTHDVEAGEIIVAEGLVPGEDYEVRARLVVDRATEWTSWTTVSTPDVKLPTPDIALSAVTPSRVGTYDPTNLVPDDQMQDRDAWGIGDAFDPLSSRSDVSLNTNALLFGGILSRGLIAFDVAATSAANVYSKRFPVAAGETLYLRCQRQAAGDAAGFVAVRYFDAEGAQVGATTIAGPEFNTTGGAAAETFTAQDTVPATAVEADFRIFVNDAGTTDTVRVGGLGAWRAADREWIVDGGVSDRGVVAYDLTGAPEEITSSSYVEIDPDGGNSGRVVLGAADPNDLWICSVYVRYRPNGADVTQADVQFQVNPQLDGVWQGWETLATFSNSTTAWQRARDSVLLGSGFDGYRIRLVARVVPDGGGGSDYRTQVQQFQVLTYSVKR